MAESAPAETGAKPATKGPQGELAGLPQDVGKIVTEAMRDQKLRQDRMRHVQEFLTSPSFLDMKDAPLLSGSTQDELQDRRTDLKYRISVLESVLAVLIEEMDVLDKFLADQRKAPEAP